MQNPFKAAARKAFADQPDVRETLVAAGVLDPMVDIKAAYQTRLRQLEQRRRDQLDHWAEVRQDDLRTRGLVLEPWNLPAITKAVPGDGNRAARRAHERHQERQVRKGQAVYRKTREQRRRNRVTAGNMARAAAGEIGTPALQANVLLVLERSKVELHG